MTRSPLVLLSIGLLSLIIMLIGGELYLRHKLPYYNTAPLPPSCRQDETLGWVNKPITTEVPSLSKNRETIRITQTKDGRRITSGLSSKKKDNQNQLVVVGGSLTYGFGLSDEETWPWLLQEKKPCATVLNYGTPGYGTYQSLLMLERVLPELSSPKIVLYGFLEHHLVRNVAPPAWRAVLNMKRKGNVYLPYVNIDANNDLVRIPPVLINQWPLSQYFTMIKFAEIMYLSKFQSREYFEKMDAAWQFLMINMRDLCASHGCRLIVVILSITHRSQKSFYTDFFDLNRINYIDVDFETPAEMLPEFLLEKDPTHPNDKANTIWANNISRHILCGVDQQVVVIK